MSIPRHRPTKGLIRFPLPHGGVVFLLPKQNTILVFNRTANFLWKVLARWGAQALPGALQARFGIPHGDACRDVEAILACWITNGALTGDGNRPKPRIKALEEPHACAGMVSEPGPPRRYRLGRLSFDLAVDADAAPHLLPLLAPFHDERSPPDFRCVVRMRLDGLAALSVDGKPKFEALPGHLLAGALYQEILGRLQQGQRFIAYIHAGAVANHAAAAILAAPSGSGKSTLIAYLTACGYRYFSDDIVALQAEDHAIAPFPLPISIKPGAAEALAGFYPGMDMRSAHASLLGVSGDFGALPVLAKALIFVEYRAGAAMAFEPISIEDALLRLLRDRIFFGYPVAPDGFADFLRWLRGAERRVLVYSEFTEAESCLKQALKG